MAVTGGDVRVVPGRIAALGLIGYVATHLHRQWLLAEEAPAADCAIAYAITAGRLCHDLQRERGSSALFIGSGGREFRTQLDAARESVDRQAAVMAEALAGCRDYPLLRELVLAGDALVAGLDAARPARVAIDRLAFTTQQSFANWTAPIRRALVSILVIGSLLQNADLARALDAYLAILEGLEKSAQERATGAGALAAGRFELAVYQRFVVLGFLQDADFAVFETHATPAQTAFFAEIRQQPVFTDVQALRSTIYDGFAHGSTGGIAAPHWFEVTTRRIEQINRVRDRIAEDLQAACRALTADTGNRRLTGIVGFTLWLGLAPLALFVLLGGGSGAWSRLKQGWAGWQAGHAQRRQQRRDDTASRDSSERARAERNARETVAAAEITELVNRVIDGDLATRLEQDGKDGFFLDVSRQLNRLTGMLQAMAGELAAVMQALGEGDLTRAVAGDYRGIFGQLKDAANRMAQQQRDFSLRLAVSAEAVKVASGEISAGSGDLAQRTESQAAALEQTAASMQAATATVKQNAASAQAASRLAMAARDIAVKGGDVVGEAVAAMDGIEGSARRIADIVSLIDEIAFQTNLLALNASVEAARAGEAGKGFAVVAQEVRALAQRSANASKDIKGLIAASNAQVKTGAALVGRTGGSLGEIVEAVKKVSDLVTEIAAASAEQARGLDEVTAAVAGMDEMTQRNAALVEETTASARALADQAADLAGLVGYFRH